MTISLDTPAWQTTSTAWKAARGIHTPWIAEVSPMQLGLMSQRQRRAYDNRRARECAASGDGFVAWKAEVMRAYDAGEFTLTSEGLFDEPRDTVRNELVARMKRAEEAVKVAERAEVFADHWTRETATVGDLVWNPVYRWMRVRRCNRDTVTLAPLDGGAFAPKLAWHQALKRNPAKPDEVGP